MIISNFQTIEIIIIRKTLTEDTVITQSFPSALREEIASLLKQFAFVAKYETSAFFEVIVDNEILTIPYRVYYDESVLSHLNGLTSMQLDIIYCIYSRHANGFVRQKCISAIIASKHSWTMPFIIRITGEYVIEILENIYSQMESTDSLNLRNFLLTNKAFYKVTKDRVASYWNYYYRMRYRQKDDFVGFKVLKYFDEIIMA